MNNCEFCFELINNCICIFHKCAECGEKIPESHASEYRGRIWCEDKHDFDEQIAKRDFQRQEVMKIVDASTQSQRNAEFKNNPGKYDLHNVAEDGLPIMKVKEPYALKEYERSE